MRGAVDYLDSMARGNRSGPRGHRAKVGGADSAGTERFSFRIPIEIVKRIRAKYSGAISDYIRGLIARDLK